MKRRVLPKSRQELREVAVNYPSYVVYPTIYTSCPNSYCIPLHTNMPTCSSIIHPNNTPNMIHSTPSLITPSNFITMPVAMNTSIVPTNIPYIPQCAHAPYQCSQFIPPRHWCVYCKQNTPSISIKYDQPPTYLI